ncbi:MAG: cytidine deaminase [Bacteroidales bacterium]|jgi:cytidine deaminase|nr:cytidine deaminase [Bacteroidales bacterium]
MKIITLSSEVQVYERAEELPEELATLLKKAKEVALSAYSPYSHFKVGAAIMLNNGAVVTGNNQENAAYPSGLCAERTAAFYASSQYPQVPFTRIAITAVNSEKELSQPVSPCGNCRQALLEYEQKFNQNIEVILSGQTGEVFVIKSIKDLLPCSFTADFLLNNDVCP